MSERVVAVGDRCEECGRHWLLPARLGGPPAGWYSSIREHRCECGGRLMMVMERAPLAVACGTEEGE